MESTDLRRLIGEQLALTRRLRERVAQLEAAARAPLAVVGMALRLPGGLTTPEAYWRFLLGDDSADTDIPADRPGLRAVYDPQPGRKDRSYVGRAGFLDDAAGFDAGFFGISNREAEALDPQQRLLLETAWEAFERSGIALRRHDGLSAGVFVGIMSAEYTARLAGGAEGVDPYYGTGGGHCFAAGRVSYALGLRGPALSVDTACSSSLVALHLAAQSLRRGECRYAVVAGANMIFSPDLMVSLCQSGALSPDGRSKPFAAAADGYGRAEGVGALILMRLDQAREEERPVLAVVRGTAVNHDGASSGLTVPNGPAQQEVIRGALADADLNPGSVGYVEAHGTGTSLGDPIEIGALDAVLGSGVSGRAKPLLVGSLKARLGHLEAASGVAGLIKLVLALRHGIVPAGLAEADGELNPLIPWERIGLTVPRRSLDWPAAPRRIAGISAFGLSGTNAHALLEAGDPAPHKPGSRHPAGAVIGVAGRTGRPELLALSAKSPAALRELAEAVRLRLIAPDPDPAPADPGSLCYTMNSGRAVFKHRLAVTGTGPAELAAALSACGDAGRLAPAPPRTATLSVRSADPRLGNAVDLLRRTFPLLRAGGGQDRADPAEWLEGALRDLGVPVVRREAKPADVPTAVLDWRGEPVALVADDPAESARALLEILAALFTDGAALRLAPLRAPSARILDTAPTYPFQRERLWIDEPAAAAGAVAARKPEAGQDPADVAVSTPAVRRFLEDELASVLKTEGELDVSASFLDLGGDSFTAMLFMTRIEQNYDIGEPVDQFDGGAPLGESLSRLADHIVREAATLRLEEVAAA